VQPEKRKIIDTMTDEAMKLESVRRWEWQDRLADAFERLLRYSDQLAKITAAVPEEEVGKIPPPLRQFFKDSSASLHVIQEGCRAKLARIEGWRKRYL